MRVQKMKAILKMRPSWKTKPLPNLPGLNLPRLRQWKPPLHRLDPEALSDLKVICQGQEYTYTWW